MDRRIPLPLIYALCAQTIGFFVWGTTLTNRVSTLESQVAIVQPLNESVVRMQEQLKAIGQSVDRIEKGLRPTSMRLGR